MKQKALEKISTKMLKRDKKFEDLKALAKKQNQKNDKNN